MRVIVADDDVIVLAGVCGLLETFGDVQVVARCSDLPSLLAAVDDDPPDVVLTDIRMPPDHVTEGIEAARVLRDSHPSVGVVVLSQFVDPQMAFAVLEHGADRRGYLLKEDVASADQLVHALRTVSTGGSFVDARVLEALVAARSTSTGPGVGRLTGRELEVLGLIAEGHANASIGERLFVGERAVEKHISSIFSKLGLSDEPGRHRRVMAVLAFLGHEASTLDGGSA